MVRKCRCRSCVAAPWSGRECVDAEDRSTGEVAAQKLQRSSACSRTPQVPETATCFGMKSREKHKKQMPAPQTHSLGALSKEGSVDRWITWNKLSLRRCSSGLCLWVAKQAQGRGGDCRTVLSQWLVIWFCLCQTCLQLLTQNLRKIQPWKEMYRLEILVIFQPKLSYTTLHLLDYIGYICKSTPILALSALPWRLAGDAGEQWPLWAWQGTVLQLLGKGGIFFWGEVDRETLTSPEF